MNPHIPRLVESLRGLLSSPDLNLDELEPATRKAIDSARNAIEIVESGLQEFRVRYARVVIMETTVLSENEDDIIAMPLPDVFEGIPKDMIASHVQEVVDYEEIWQVSSSGACNARD